MNQTQCLIWCPLQQTQRTRLLLLKILLRLSFRRHLLLPRVAIHRGEKEEREALVLAYPSVPAHRQQETANHCVNSIKFNVDQGSRMRMLMLNPSVGAQEHLHRFTMTNISICAGGHAVNQQSKRANLYHTSHEFYPTSPTTKYSTAALLWTQRPEKSHVGSRLRLPCCRQS